MINARIIYIILSMPINLSAFMLYRYLPLYWHNVGILVGFIGFGIYYHAIYNLK